MAICGQLAPDAERGHMSQLAVWWLAHLITSETNAVIHLQFFSAYCLPLYLPKFSKRNLQLHNVPVVQNVLVRTYPVTLLDFTISSGFRTLSIMIAMFCSCISVYLCDMSYVFDLIVFPVLCTFSQVTLLHFPFVYTLPEILYKF